MSAGSVSYENVRAVSRREVARHQNLILGLTASAPRYDDRGDGIMEFVVDVRVGIKEGQGLIKKVLIAQWAEGLVTDFNVPVLMERSEAGRLTVIARAQVKLPNVRLTTYSYGALGIPFASNLWQESDTEEWFDGFGYPATDPNVNTEMTQEWVWQQYTVSIDDLGEFDAIDQTLAEWQRA